MLPRRILSSIAATIAVAALAPAAFAASVTLEAAPVLNNNGVDFLPSNGGLHGTSGFTVTRNDIGDSVALRARSQDNGNTIVHNGTSYLVNPGYTGTRPNFYLEYQFTPGTGEMGYYDDYSIQVDIDSDTGYSFSGKGDAAYWTTTDGYLDYGQSGSPADGTGPWKYPNGSTVAITDVRFVIANSWQLPWFEGMPGATTTGTYDPFAQGNYDVTFTVFDGDTEVLSNTISATVVPSPTAALGGMGMLGLVALRRRLA